MNNPQHRAEPNAETIEAERKAERWFNMNGTSLPEWGQHRLPSIMSVDEAEARAAA